MIGLLPTTTIFLATAPTDLRKAYDGLAVLVRQSLGQDPLSGSLYVSQETGDATSCFPIRLNPMLMAVFLNACNLRSWNFLS